MPERLLHKLGKIRLTSQVGALIGGAGVVGGAVAVAGLGGGAFVLHKLHQVRHVQERSLRYCTLSSASLPELRSCCMIVSILFFCCLQRRQRTSDRDAAMQHAVEKVLWLQAGKVSSTIQPVTLFQHERCRD